MLVDLNALIYSIVKFKSLNPALDKMAMGLKPDTDLQIYSTLAYLPTSVLKMLWNGCHNKKLHIGVLGLLLRLDKCPTVGQQAKSKQRYIKQYLNKNGIDYNKLDDAMIYAAKLGVRRKLFSKPWLGYSHRARAKINNKYT